jgi:hypothetical protein
MSKQRTRKAEQEQVTLNLGDGKPLVIGGGGGNLTGLAGLPLLRKVEKIFKLVEGASDRLKDHRTQSLIDHNKFDLWFVRVAQIAVGLPSCNDADLVMEDAGLLKALGRDPEEGLNGPSQPTQCRFENSVNDEDLKELSEFLVDYFIRTHRKVPRRLVLYADGTAVETHGRQQGAVRRGGKYKMEMLFPLLVFDETGWLLAAELREGDKGEAPSGTAIIKKLVERLKSAWPHVKIGLRLDAGFPCPGLFNWCEENGIDYVVGIAGNFAIASKAADYLREANRQFVRKHGQPEFIGCKGKRKKQRIHARIRRMPKDQRMDAEQAWRKRRVRIYGEFLYQSRTWTTERRIICRADYTDDGVQTRYLVTNLTWGYAQQIYEQEYCPHARVELCIKELKNSLALRLSCSEFNANAFRLFLHALAYQLLYHLRQFLPPPFRKLSLESIRKMFLTVCARVTCSARRVYWALSDTYAYTRDFMRVCKRLARAG